eukprot:CAMPEP_0172529588 /NCGR_PEP_ID=MMETSP1067-20121228/3631_1 /TAXON_ID=265564 ORGANISM="Thalassiosira punctigera, Strain Tpunct2005C2" /NCGR_SAMPLE_ID=MMETSP1067 /ASSEMBLY_ACC=CAM_ASM_000444 /LENGTH=431 /DNA_ID=CAMNT_0013313667 /DNA_START=21 /DNA_END=1316 /DNA_ORIENTATION=-
MLFFFSVFSCICCSASSVSAAFVSPSTSYLTARYRTSAGAQKVGGGGRKHDRLLRPSTRLKSDDGDDADENNSPPRAIGGELVSALARLDKKWELARADGGKKIGDWNILDLKGEDETSPEIVYLLEPTSGAVPSCVIFFLGGAVLGQFPHISYSVFLQRVAARMNASVLAIPYEVNLDHLGIAQRAVSRMKNAVIECEDSRGYPPELPKYAIGHSLGAKLHGIGIAATGMGEELSGVGFVSYNNFGFAETISMARSFAKELQVGNDSFGFGAGSTVPFDALFDLAGMAVSAVGLEFTPSPSEMDRIVKTKFDGELLKKTRMFQFEDDDLDSTKSFFECFEGDRETPSLSYLPGTHLTPVFLQFGLDDIPDEAKDVASQVTGGFKNASFGDEEALGLLVEEVSDWMLGRNPKDRRAARKQIAGTIDAEIEE